jgi:polysaccharide biosynthesis/export protein
MSVRESNRHTAGPLPGARSALRRRRVPIAAVTSIAVAASFLHGTTAAVAQAEPEVPTAGAPADPMAGAEAGAFAPSDSPLYQVGPGDELRITVAREPDLSVTVPVRPDGRLSMPLIEEIDAAGRTPSELARMIEAELDRYLLSPMVTVEVVTAEGDLRQQIRVVGTAIGPEVAGVGPAAVRQRFPIVPRGIPYREGITVLDVITEAGGLSPFAAGNRATIIRMVDDRRTEIPVRLDDLVRRGDMTADVPMAPGDVLLIPEGAFAGIWETALTAGAFLTFTDNVNLAPSDLKDSALITTLTPGVSIRGTTPRFFGGLNTTLNLAYQEVFGDNVSGVTDGFEVYVDLLGAATIEAAPDLLFIDTSMSITQQQTGGLDDERSSSPFVLTGTVPVVSFRFSPYIPARFGDVGEAQLRYTFATTFEGTDEFDIASAFTDREDLTLINALGLTFVSGPGTSQWGPWSSEVYGSKETRDDLDDLDTAGVEFTYAYPINYRLFALGSVGWDYFDDGIADNRVSAPAFAVGTRWVPNPQLNLTATVGYRFERASGSLNFVYTPSPRTSMFADYSEGLTTGTRALARSSAFLRIDPLTGEFVDTRTGFAFDPTIRGTIDNVTTYRRDFRAGFATTQGRNTYGLNAGVFFEERQPDGDDEQEYFVAGNVSRQLGLRTRGIVGASYSLRDLTDRTDNIYRASVGLDYTFYRTIAATATYNFQMRDSDFPQAEFTENVFTVGVTGTF